MAIFKWIRDLLGIKKDVVETKKTKLEIKQLQDEQRIIKQANLDDIIRIDLKTKKLLVEIQNKPCYESIDYRARKKNLLIRIIIFLALIILIGAAIYLMKIF